MDRCQACGHDPGHGPISCAACRFVRLRTSPAAQPLTDEERRERLREQRRALGVCSECGRGLTDPLSVSRGIGPDCWSQLHG